MCSTPWLVAGRHNKIEGGQNKPNSGRAQQAKLRAGTRKLRPSLGKPALPRAGEAPKVVVVLEAPEVVVLPAKAEDLRKVSGVHLF